MSHTFRALLLTLALPAAAQIGSAPVDIPRPEHPRPDFMRKEWRSLNGIWEFAETDNPETSFLDREMPDRIVVPFCRESKLSGLERKGFVTYVWYRRDFEVPAQWAGKRVLFHVGACDWQTTAWVNGQKVGEHQGGSTPFTFDITGALQPGKNTVTLKVYDDHRTGCQASGKQSPKPESFGCMYTRTTGIWQTVWLEAVSETHIQDHFVITDIQSGHVALHARVEGPREGVQVVAEASVEGKVVGLAEAPAAWGLTSLGLALSEKRLWSIEDPFLYDLKLQLVKGGVVIDEVKTYFGLRKIEVQGAAILLNGKPVFQRLALDQGFYPDGIWTAPSDAALVNDIDLSMAAGFNGARLHQKVFEPRFLYHADRLGYLVWGEYPNWGLNYTDTRIDEPVIREWTTILERDANHPAIVGWCPFNETPAEAARIQNIIVDLTRRIDPTRPVLDVSGYIHSHPGVDLLDAHDYDQDPAIYKARWDGFFGLAWKMPERYGLKTGAAGGKPFFVSEFGGIGWQIGSGWGYGNAPKSLDEYYERFTGLVNANLDNRNFFGYCYTQLTDVEQEHNGIYTYQREKKFDVPRLHQIQSRKAVYETNPPADVVPPEAVEWTVLLPAAQDHAADGEWRYTFEQPADSWNQANFEETGWKTGKPGFGSVGGDLLGTEWKTKDIWLRKKADHSGGDFDVAALIAWYDNATEIYLNGELIWKKGGWSNCHEVFDVSEAVRKNLKKGTNSFAVHTHQDQGGQFIDAGLLLGKKGR
jgi:hypothetical protein